MKRTAGIHHITAIVGHPRVNLDFYANTLGLRLVKKTVNFDDPGTYHLYFGNKKGEPGTIITFFPWMDARKGKITNGQVGITAYAVPKGALFFWEDRLTSLGVNFNIVSKFGEDVLRFADPDGLQIELVERETSTKNEWPHDDIPEEYAITGFAGATLYSFHPEGTGEILTDIMGLEKVAEENETIRYRAYGDVGNIIDVTSVDGEVDYMGRGTVHHIAFRATDDQDQLDWKAHVQNHGLPVTEVRDRNYFNAIYFREVGGILFEIATDPPGFAVDEDLEALGEKLMLPAQYEQNRTQLEQTLPKIGIR